MNTAANGDEMPFAELFPILLYVLLTILITAADAFYEGIGRQQPAITPWLEQVTVWVTMVPYYLYKIQRWRALAPIGAYVLLMIAASAVGTMVRMAVSRP
jgi:hypothetical protein